MRHRSILSILAILFMVNCGTKNRKPELTRIDDNNKATYKVEILPRGHGSGIVLHEDGLILTNYHVSGDGERLLRVTISEANGKPTHYYGKVVAVDKEFDIGVIKLNHKFKKPVILEKFSNLNEGDSVYNIGYPYSFGKLVSRGSISALAWNDSDIGVKNAIVVDMEWAHPGTSGSGVYSVTSGKLIGLVKMIAWIKRSNRPEMTIKILVGVDDIKRFLDANNIPYHDGSSGGGNWAVPVGVDPVSPYRIEIIQVQSVGPKRSN